MFKAVLSDETAACNIVWFHGAFLKNKLEPGMIVMASGKPAVYKNHLQLTNVGREFLEMFLLKILFQLFLINFAVWKFREGISELKVFRNHKWLKPEVATWLNTLSNLRDTYWNTHKGANRRTDEAWLYS